MGEEMDIATCTGDGFSSCYKDVQVEGISCIEWTFPDLPQDKRLADKERAKRRRIKDYVGAENPDIPMLDSKTDKNGRAYCDVIIITDYIDSRETAMTDHYNDHRCEEKKLHTHGHQKTWYDGVTPTISAHFYPNKGKLMVQPGERDPARLDAWIRLVDVFRSSLSTSESNGCNDDPLLPTAPPAPNTPERLIPSAPTRDSLDASPHTVHIPGELHKEQDENEEAPQIHNDPQVTGQMITDVLRNMTKLTNEVTQMVKKIDDITEYNQKLTQDNSALRQHVAALTQKISEISWQSFRPAHNAHTSHRLLIGSSIIRDVDECKLADTTVICKPGGTINTVKNEVSKLKKSYDNITLVVGGNDCDNQQHCQAADIVKSYKELVDMSVAKSRTVTVSSVCPRLTSDTTQDQIERVNAGLLDMCVDRDNVTFANSTPSFMLADGSINDGYFHPDGVHITRAATNKMASNLKLNVRNKAEGVCKDGRRPTTRHVTHQNTSRDSPPGRIDHTDDVNLGWETQRHQRRSARRNQHRNTSDKLCNYCAESGHLQKDCRHGQPVECNRCHVTGHKAKFCEMA